MHKARVLASVALIAGAAATSVVRAGDDETATKEAPSFPRAVLVELFTSQG